MAKKQDKITMLDYPLLNGKKLGDATKLDLKQEAQTDTEMDSICDKMAVTGVEGFATTHTAEARKFHEYLRRVIDLAEVRRAARASQDD